MERCLRTRLVALAIVLVVIVVFGACSNKSDRARVSGLVTLDKQPLQSGIIRFTPTDSRIPPAEATIIDGKYSLDMALGEKRVFISAPKVVGKRKVYDTPDSPMVDVTQELVPARYNAQTELTFTAAQGAQSKDFDLTTAK